MRILVVDDSRVARAVIRKVLGEIGISSIEEASDGAEALVKLRKSGFDMVISDWNMPRMDGIALVRAIVGAPDLDVPVLMVSGETYATRFIEVIRAGAQGYLPKPFTADALQVKIAEVAKKREMRQGYEEPASIRGGLAEIAFPELVQFVGSCAKVGRLEISHAKDNVPYQGFLQIRGGEVVAAYCNDRAGDEAVYLMAEWDNGQFQFHSDDSTVETNVSMPMLQLLVEAMKRRDERAHEEQTNAR